MIVYPRSGHLGNSSLQTNLYSQWVVFVSEDKVVVVVVVVSVFVFPQAIAMGIVVGGTPCRFVSDWLSLMAPILRAL
jgi:hypothetical protein